MAKTRGICWALFGAAAFVAAAPTQPELNPANGFSAKLADGNLCRLAAIGRPTTAGFAFWDTDGKRIATPSGYTRPRSALAGIDTVLVIEENRQTSRNFLTDQENALIPIDAFGTLITMCQGAGSTQGTPESGVASDRSLVAHHYLVPFSVIREDGTANFEFRATTSLHETLEELTPNGGWSKTLKARYEVFTKLVGKETQMEVRLRNPAPGLDFAARVRDESGKLREMMATGHSASSFFFTLTKGQIEKLLVVRPVVARVTISGVPMVPEGLAVIPTRINRITALPAPRDPERGEPATAMNGWRGRTIAGNRYALEDIADQTGAWNPIGIPIWRPSSRTDDAQTTLRLGADFRPIGPVQVINPISKEVLPIKLKAAGSVSTGNWTESNFDLASDAPDYPVTLRFPVPGRRGEFAEIREICLKRIVSNRPL